SSLFLILNSFFPQVMLSLLLLFLLPISSYQQTSRQCLSCASEGLKSRWFLTGLSSAPMADDKFIDSCGAATSNLIPRESCSGPCFTYIFDDPDSTGAIEVAQLVVRGCHQTMVGLASDRTQSAGAQNGVFCEYDATYLRPNSRGTMVNSKTLVEFCGGQEDGCNKRKTGSTTNDCTGQTYNNTVNGAINSCYECTANDKNCKESKCSKKYCTKSVVKFGNSYTVRKTCANANILGMDNACTDADITETAGDVSVKLSYKTCMCKNNLYCNGSPAILSCILFILISAVVLIFDR
ncbi:hypothetical protein PMAYCL1PPCAC_04020, partial [Pristionchus mayeri]